MSSQIRNSYLFLNYVPSRGRYLYLHLCLTLHLNFVYASSVGSFKSVCKSVCKSVFLLKPAKAILLTMQSLPCQVC